MRAAARVVVEGCAVATVDAAGTELESGHLVVEGDRIVAVGPGLDGAASNEAGQLAPELRQALLVARLRGGAGALTARQALALGPPAPLELLLIGGRPVVERGELRTGAADAIARDARAASRKLLASTERR